MKKSRNDVTLIGRLGHDAKVKPISTEKTLVVFSLATTDTWKNELGEKQQSSDWHECEYWRSEKIAPYLKKGMLIKVGGSISYKSYEKGKEGHKVKVREAVIELDVIDFLDSKKQA